MLTGPAAFKAPLQSSQKKVSSTFLSSISKIYKGMQAAKPTEIAGYRLVKYQFKVPR